MRKIRIGTRKSRLACIQAEIVADYIREHCEGYQAELVKMTTTGDNNLTARLDEIGQKGVFVKELDDALRNGDTDLSVHSLKDMPPEVDSRLPIIGFSRREDARDVLVLPKGVKEYDYRAPIGSSSNRRIVQLKQLYPGAEIKTIRGNVLTRLEKLDHGEYGGLILAAAGLKRLGLKDRISRYFSVDEMIPAAGQGILCVQGRIGESYGFLQGFFDLESEICARSERACMAYLNGGCSLPFGVYAEILDEEKMQIRGLYCHEDSGICQKLCITGDRRHPEALGIALAEKLKEHPQPLTAKDTDGCAGKVWLTGAGPGSAELLTLKAKRLLKEGDCIVYDRLVSPEVLSLIPPDKECIDVGKSAGKHTVPQERINQILIQKAKLGKKVVRLKGGDPFLFGRGGEEAEALCREKIPFEVVPGISSSIAVPAYNGIPVTHRDYVSSVHIVTGHRKPNGEDDAIPYDALVKAKGTLIFLMGVASLGKIMEGLLLAGMDAQTPAAALQEGTLAGQKKLIATVGTLTRKAKEKQIKAPSVIIVGEVCRLAGQFGWRERLPLFGERVIVTRPRERGLRLQETLTALGAEVLSIPAIQTVPVRETSQIYAIESELKRLGQYQVLAFTSPYGAERFFEILLELGMDVRAVSHMKFAAIGQGTADALLQKGLKADYMPKQYDGASLGKLLANTLEDGTKILFARSSIGGKEALDEIAKNPALKYTDLAIYDTEYLKGNEAVLRSALEEKTAVKAIFTSRSSVEGFCRLSEDFSYDRSKILAVCIGEKTGQAAEKAGMKTILAKNATIDELVHSILNLKK